MSGERFTTRDAAVEIMRSVVEQLQPPGTEYHADAPWLRAMLADPALAARVEEEVAAMGREGMRAAREITREAKKRAEVAQPAAEAVPQLGLFGGMT